MCIRTEEQLPVFKKLDAMRSLAIARGRITDIPEVRGQVEEALRIYERNVLQDVEALGDPAQIECVRKRIASLRESLRASSAGPAGG